ncbi:ImmA/IrrE family metallo-endopeptidase [Oxalobacteraceae bacterium R-40]|uniref:ImmA/IrrE family metallo-endopeptidase n=1 Tax=Keguizhuia sedimenti TaxID=3064264 RepID=A0ABU1BT78_9BURK|nr:ImmA/IrrE family metallo-endopeptidase [Oxalobacteraceae bacterium R-40]
MNPSIEEKATATLEQLNLTSIPIDPASVAARLGLSVRFESFSDDLSGVLMRKPEGSIVAVNSRHGVARQRFTIAHEIGHHVLQHKGDLFIDQTVLNRRDGRSSYAIDSQEIEANAFAAALLMPRQQVTNELIALMNSSMIEQKNLARELANRFQVSEQAMSFRLVNLGLITSLE